MIKNDRQYRVTKAQVSKLSQTLKGLPFSSQESEGLHPLLVEAQRNALKSQIEDLNRDLREYESVRAGNFDIDSLQAVADIPYALIKARIAMGLTHKDLAELAGLKEQQIQRYESTDYASANLFRIRELSDALSTLWDQSHPTRGK